MNIRYLIFLWTGMPLLMAAVSPAAPTEPQVDLVIHNGIIRTMDDNLAHSVILFAFA